MPKYGQTDKSDDFHRVRRLVSRIRSYQRKEPREAVYQVASRAVDQCWAKRDYEMLARAVTALLISWNARVHVGRKTSFDMVSDFIRRNYSELCRLRKLDLHKEPAKFSDRGLYDELLRRLTVRSKNNASLSTPVGTVKALHILAPRYFPLWDREIAARSGHSISRNPHTYRRFGDEARQLVKRLVQTTLLASRAQSEDAALAWLKEQTCTRGLRKTWVKFADEYNYVRYVLEPGEGKRVRRGHDD